MRSWFLAAAGAAFTLAAASTQAQTPAAVTATCKDGTAYSGATKSGACRGHGGVMTWGSTGASAMPAPAATMTAPPTMAAAAAAPAVVPPATTSAKPVTGSSAKALPPMAPGGGPGLVWVNTSSKTYHCLGTKYYGRTKKGEYMPEADAISKGFHGPKSKSCAPA